VRAGWFLSSLQSSLCDFYSINIGVLFTSFLATIRFFFLFPNPLDFSASTSADVSGFFEVGLPSVCLSCPSFYVFLRYLVAMFTFIGSFFCSLKTLTPPDGFKRAFPPG